MVLNIFEDVGNYFKNFFTQNLLGNLLTLFFGILIGFLLTLLIYVIVVLVEIKKASKEYEIVNIDDKNKKIQECIDLALVKYDDIVNNLDYIDNKEHFSEARQIAIDMVISISKIYYPDSKYSFGEISVEELMQLIRYILDRIDELFINHRFLRIFKKVTISFVLNVLGWIDKVNNNKVMKGIRKYNIDDGASFFLKIKNSINPVYWIRRGMMKQLFRKGLPKMIRIVIEIIGNETAKVYSKSLFDDSKIKIDKNEFDSDEIKLMEEYSK